MKKRILTNLSKAVADLKRALDADVVLEETDRLFIENHIVLLKGAYTRWKSRNQNENRVSGTC